MAIETYAQKEYDLLIAPTLDSKIAAFLSSVSAPADSTLKAVKDATTLHAEDKIIDYNASNLSGSSVAFLTRSFFQTALNATFRTSVGNIDLSLRAVIYGDHYPRSMFGKAYNGIYDPDKSKERSPIASSFHEANTGLNTCSYFMFTQGESYQRTGAEIFSDFFNRLSDAKKDIDRWLKSNPNFRHETSDLWKMIEQERRRLGNTNCKVIPYNEHGK